MGGSFKERTFFIEIIITSAIIIHCDKFSAKKIIDIVINF
jgi:hypothetical protein